MSSTNAAPKRGFTALEVSVREETEEIKHLENILRWG